MSPTLKGVLAAVGGILFLTVNDAESKYLTQSFPVGQVICLRQAATLLYILPYVALVTGFGALRIVSWRGQLVRGALFVGGSAFMVAGLAVLPLPTVITIMFVSPAFIAALSAPLLGERVGLHRWLAIAGGFAGVVVVMRPGGTSFEWALLIPVAGAFTNAFRDIMTRRLARTETSVSILFWSAVIVTIANATTAPVWEPVPASAAAWFVFVGLLNTGAHFLLIEAYRLAEAALVAPVRYTGLIWAVLLGYAVWGHVPDMWVVLGAAVIVASGIYMIRAESKASAAKAALAQHRLRAFQPQVKAEERR